MLRNSSIEQLSNLLNEIQITPHDNFPIAKITLADLRRGQWAEVFGVAVCGDWQNSTPQPVAVVPPGSVPSMEHGFYIDDVARIFAGQEGENEGLNWILLGQLVDGRYFYLMAGNGAYTGFEINGHGDACVAHTWDDIVRYGLSAFERKEFNLQLPEEKTLAQLGQKHEDLAHM